jgi:hypothetical protein
MLAALHTSGKRLPTLPLACLLLVSAVLQAPTKFWRKALTACHMKFGSAGALADADASALDPVKTLQEQ